MVPEPPSRVEIKRFAANPIVRPGMLPGRDGENINGPSLLRVPDWVTNRLGTYYLYFAHHGGKYIRLACADRLEGPWKIYQPGVLKLSEAPACRGHIASPDVHADEARREIRLYFHGPARDGGEQTSYVAGSSDGLHFQASAEPLGSFYFRVFRWQDAWWAVAKAGQLYRSADGLTKFTKGPNPLPASAGRGAQFNEPGPRHFALRREGDTLWIYYTSIGDAPERIFRCQLRLTADWNEWKASTPQEVLRPETEWEGASLPLKKSVSGAVKERENALRDPCIFTDRDGRDYLLYSVAGESGIAIAEILPAGGATRKP